MKESSARAGQKRNFRLVAGSTLILAAVILLVPGAHAPPAASWLLGLAGVALWFRARERS